MSIVEAAEVDRLVNELHRDGICVLRRALEPGLITAWRRAFDALSEARRATAGHVAERGVNRFYLTLPWTEPFADERVFSNRRIRAVLDRVLGLEYVMVQLAADTALPGSQYQELHRDHPPLFSEDFVTPLYALAVNFALCPVTYENGPLEVVRGTHRISKEEGLARVTSAGAAIEPITLDVGDVIIRTPLALHRGSPNRSDCARPMIVMGYVRSWLYTPHLDLTVPRHVHERLSPEARDFLRCKVTDELPRTMNESYLRFQY